MSRRKSLHYPELNYHDETRVIHALPNDPATGAVSTPIYQTSTFEFHSRRAHYLVGKIS